MTLLLSAAAGFASGAASTLVRWVRGPQPVRVAALSARRLRALTAIAEVVPSVYGTERFTKLAPGLVVAEDASGEVVKTVNGVKQGKTFTECGYLPCYVGRRLGDPRGITQCGLEQARKNAIAQNAWRKAGGDARPAPGDIFLVVDEHDTPLHVGMYVGRNADGTWRTADAGQGTKKAPDARYLDRPYDAERVTLGGPAGPRRLAGWVDLDAVQLHDVDAVAGQVLDVRSVKEYRRAHVDGALNLPVDSVITVMAREATGHAGVSGLDKARPVFVYCGSGTRSARAAHALEGAGYRVTDMGGWQP